MTPHDRGGDAVWPRIDVGVPPGPGVAGLVSTVVPTFNRAREMTAAVASALSQSCPEVEVVIADDGSTDHTASLVRGLGTRVRYVRQANAGVSAARNLGLRNARGEFVAFLDSDDAWKPWKVEAQLAVLRARPDVGMIWTDMAAVSPEGDLMQPAYLRTYYGAYQQVRIEEVLECIGSLRQLWSAAPESAANAPVYVGEIFPWMLLGNLVHTSTVLLRRERLLAVGGFDEALRISGEDYDFHLRTTYVGRIAFLDVPSTLYRIGGADQLSNPDKVIHIARNNLRTVTRALVRTGKNVPLPPSLLRARIARSHAWVGEEELRHGDGRAARRSFLASLNADVWQPRLVPWLGFALLPGPVRRAVRGAVRALKRTFAR